MPYTNISQIPESIKGAGLSLSQANDWARYYDGAKKQEGVENPAGIAWTRFKLKYKKVGDKWAMKSKTSKPWESKEKEEGTMRYLYGRKRDEIAKRLFSKMFNELTDEQKAKVHNEAVSEHSMNVGIGNIIFNADNDGVCKFSFIVQTEGIHQGITGNKVMYTKEIFEEFGNSLIGKGVSDDPAHIESISGYKKLGNDFANIIETEIQMINAELAEEFGIDSSLVGKYALIAHADGYDPKYNYLIRNKKVNYFSSELTYSGTKNADGVWIPDYINYDGVVALSDRGADPGAIMLDIYNTKYGGKKMTDKNTEELESELKKQKERNAELETEVEGIKKDAETKSEEAVKEVETKVEEAEAKNTELQEKIKELSKGEFDLKQAEEKIEALNVKNTELEEKVSGIEETKEKIESLNTKIKGMRDEKRVDVLKEHVSNADITKSIIEQDFSDEEFNAKIDEIQKLKDEAKKEAIEGARNAGIAPVELNSNPDDFKEFWGATSDELVKEFIGGEKE